MKRFLLVQILFPVFAITVFAGDVATFVNLGFSRDSSYFMYGQYGRDGENLLSYGELFLVDVTSNKFVSKGALTKSVSSTVQGEDGSGVILSLFWDAKEKAQNLAIDPLAKGRPIYIRLNGSNPSGSVAFRDFVTNLHYNVSLNQRKYENVNGISSSFGIELVVTWPNGRVERRTIGHPDYIRDGVIDYKLREIFLGPDEKSMVFLVERREESGGAINIRYMVETVRLP